MIVHRALSKSAGQGRAGQGRDGRQLPKHLEPGSPPVPPGDNSLFVWGGAPSAHVEPWQERQVQAVVLSPGCFHRMPGRGAGGRAPPSVSTPLLKARRTALSKVSELLTFLVWEAFFWEAKLLSNNLLPAKPRDGIACPFSTALGSCFVGHIL